MSAEHIEFALAWGDPISQPEGRVAYHLSFREAAEARGLGVRIPERAIGVGVVLAGDGTVVRSPDRRRPRTHGQRPRRRPTGGVR